MLWKYLLGGSQRDCPELFQLCSYSDFCWREDSRRPQTPNLRDYWIQAIFPGHHLETNSLSVHSTNHLCKLISTSPYRSLDYMLPRNSTKCLVLSKYIWWVTSISLSFSLCWSNFFFLRDFISDSLPTGHLMNHPPSSENICSQRLWTLQGKLFLAEVQAVLVVKMI